jgi:alpha-beta hydrolase superfamily lysophospholipase
LLHGYCKCGGIHAGFEVGIDVSEMKKELVDFDKKIIGRTVMITGHSMGGALTTIAATRLKKEADVSALV